MPFDMMPLNANISKDSFLERTKPVPACFNTWAFQEKRAGKVYCLRRGASQHANLVVRLDEGLYEQGVRIPGPHGDITVGN